MERGYKIEGRRREEEGSGTRELRIILLYSTNQKTSFPQLEEGLFINGAQMRLES